MNNTETQPISNTDDVIDVRSVIDRLEYLRESWADATGDSPDDYTLSEDDWKAGLDDDEAHEVVTLAELLDDLKGNGGDHQWHGDWYPVTLIHEDYFETYARELAEDIGAIPRDYSWPASHIDWKAAADALLMDYGAYDFDGQTYYAR